MKRIKRIREEVEGLVLSLSNSVVNNPATGKEEKRKSHLSTIGRQEFRMMISFF